MTEKQNTLEAQESPTSKIHELKKEYLAQTDVQNATTIKTEIYKQASEQLNTQELLTLKNELSQEAQSLTGESKWKVYEILAGLYNRFPMTPKIENVQELNLAEIQEPTFFVTGGTIERNGQKINIASPEFPKLNQFNEKGQYILEPALYIEHYAEENSMKGAITGAAPEALIISRNPNGSYDIFDQNGIKETSVPAKNGKITFQIPRIDTKFILQVEKAK